MSEGAGGQEVPDGEDGRVQENLAGDGLPDGCRGEEGRDLEVPVLSGGGEDPEVQEDVEGGVRPQLVRLRATRIPRTGGQNRHTRPQQTTHSAHPRKSLNLVISLDTSSFSSGIGLAMNFFVNILLQNQLTTPHSVAEILPSMRLAQAGVYVNLIRE